MKTAIISIICFLLFSGCAGSSYSIRENTKQSGGDEHYQRSVTLSSFDGYTFSFKFYKGDYTAYYANLLYEGNDWKFTNAVKMRLESKTGGETITLSNRKPFRNVFNAKQSGESSLNFSLSSDVIKSILDCDEMSLKIYDKNIKVSYAGIDKIKEFFLMLPNTDEFEKEHGSRNKSEGKSGGGSGGSGSSGGDEDEDEDDDDEVEEFGFDD